MWIFLAILIVIFTSWQDILSKKIVRKANPYLVTWAWWCFTLPFLLVCLPFSAKPQLTPQFWLALGFSVFFLSFAVIYYIKALEATELSLSVPMLNFTPLLLLVTSPIMLKEAPTPLGLAGVMLIVFGAYLLFIRKEHVGWLAPFQNLFKDKGARYMLWVAIIFSVSGNFDKIGVMNSSPLVWIVSVNVSLSVVLTVVMLIKSKNVIEELKEHWPALMWLGAANTAALLAQMTAIQMTQVPYLIAFKRTSVVLTSLYGFLVLKEEGMKERLAAIVIMMAGVVLICLPG